MPTPLWPADVLKHSKFVNQEGIFVSTVDFLLAKRTIDYSNELSAFFREKAGNASRTSFINPCCFLLLFLMLCFLKHDFVNRVSPLPRDAYVQSRCNCHG